MTRYSSIFPIALPISHGALAIISRPRGGDWLDDDIAHLKLDGLNHIVSLLEPHEEADLGLTSERDTVTRLGLRFTSIPVVDRSVPKDDRSFVKAAGFLAEALRGGDSVGVHCRQSVGRSSLIVVVTLKILGQGLNDALKNVQAARGLPVPETAAQLAWLHGVS